MELLRGAAGILRFPDHDGDLVEFDEFPTVTVVRHSDGTEVAVGAVTKEGEEEDAFYVAAVDSTATVEVDLLIATWSGKVGGADNSYTTYAEVVGGFVVSLKAIKKKLDARVEPGDDETAAAREAATRQIEAACAVAFRPRYGKAVLDGTGTETLMLPDPQLVRVLSVAARGKGALDPSTLVVDPAGFLINPDRWTEGRQNISVAYVHGYETFSPVALPVRDLAAYLMTQDPTDWNARATSYSTGDATYSLVTAGMRGMSFPLPEVNAFVQQHEFISVG